MIKKHRKKILLALILTFVFNFSFVYKKTEASVIAIGGIALSALVLVGAGVAITSPEMANDLGGKLWSVLKDVVEIPQKIGDFFETKITETMINTALDWIEGGNIPTEPVESVTTEIINFPHTLKNVSYSNLGTEVAYYKYKTTFVTDYKRFSIPITINGVKYDLFKDRTITSPFNEFSIGLQGLYGGKEQTCITLTTYSNGVELQSAILHTFDEYLTINEMVIGVPSINEIPLSGNPEVENKVTIPYSPETSANVSKDKLTTELPVGSTVTFPSDLVTNFPATADKPISTVTDIPNVNVGASDIPNTDTGILEGLLEGVNTLVDAVVGGLGSIVDFIGNIFVPDGELPKLNFAPLYFPLTGKFPFCIPFDLINTFKEMVSGKKAPSFTVNFPKNIFVGGGSFDIDFSQFNELILIVRYFLLLCFCISLILITKRLIN